jgi:PTH2 family peptidyl-tRNA hydrolase
MRDAKQVIVMRKDLHMRKGKMIAQGAHASMKVLLDRGHLAGTMGGEGGGGGVGVEGGEGGEGGEGSGHEGDGRSSAGAFVFTLNEAIAAWIAGRFTKVCVSVNSEAELAEVHERARAAGLPCALVVDSGRTEFHGVPTPTCCAVGPAWTEEVDAVTGGLPLL